MLAAYNLDRMIKYFKIERKEVPLECINPYIYALDRRKKTDYRDSMVA